MQNQPSQSYDSILSSVTHNFSINKLNFLFNCYNRKTHGSWM